MQNSCVNKRKNESVELKPFQEGSCLNKTQPLHQIFTLQGKWSYSPCLKLWSMVSFKLLREVVHDRPWDLRIYSGLCWTLWLLWISSKRNELTEVTKPSVPFLFRGIGTKNGRQIIPLKNICISSQDVQANLLRVAEDWIASQP